VGRVQPKDSKKRPAPEWATEVGLKVGDQFPS